MTTPLARLTAAVIFFSFSLATIQAADKPASQPWDLMWAVKIPMRDGVKLNATVYRPHEQKGPLPVIFELTPYISDSYHERGTYFAQH